MDYRDYILQSDETGLHFWYAARLKLIDILLKKTLINQTDARSILDIGCGTGTELDLLAGYGRVIALDINQTALKIARQKNYRTISADIEKLSLPENSYDAVCCFDSLEHLTDEQKVLNNIFRSLKDDGYLLFTVPAFQFLFSTHDLALQHHRRYSQHELKEKLTTADFNIITIGYWNSILFPLEALVRLSNKFSARGGSAFGGNKSNKKSSYQSDAKPINPLLNKILFSVLNLENKIINYGIKLPFGLTIYGIARKNIS